jgi:hypothetical protein
MSNVYNASVTVSRAFPAIEPLVEELITDGKGTFTVNGPDDHRLEITSGTFVNPSEAGVPVYVRGIATVNPPALGAFLINETMHTDSYDAATQQATFNGPIVLAAVPVNHPALSAAATS